jgi:hypothetical protein
MWKWWETIVSIQCFHLERNYCVWWSGGVIQSKFHNAKLRIEERMVDNEVRYVLLKVWVQFTRLPLHLRDYLFI